MGMDQAACLDRASNEQQIHRILGRGQMATKIADSLSQDADDDLAQRKDKQQERNCRDARRNATTKHQRQGEPQNGREQESAVQEPQVAHR